jgi:hypothetical protein
MLQTTRLTEPNKREKRMPAMSERHITGQSMGSDFQPCSTTCSGTPGPGGAHLRLSASGRRPERARQTLA